MKISLRTIALMVIFLSLATVAAHATDKPKIGNQAQAQDQQQDQSQDQHQWQSQDQANSQAINFDLPAQENDITLRNTAPGIAPNIYPAGNCYQVWSGGIGVPGFNASGGKSVLDEGCRKLEWVRMAYQVGMRDAAIHALCSMPEAADVPQCGSAQDYNREMKLVELDNAELVRQVDRLKKDREALLQERQDLIDRHKYELERCAGKCSK